MILPTKHIRPDRALIGVGAEVLSTLGQQKMTMSRLWDEIRSRRSWAIAVPVIDYRWFVLALDMLYMISAVKFNQGLISKATP